MDVPTEHTMSIVDAMGAARVQDRWVVPCSDALDRQRGLTVLLGPDESVLGFPAGSTAIMTPDHARAVCLLAEFTNPGVLEKVPDIVPDGLLGEAPVERRDRFGAAGP